MAFTHFSKNGSLLPIDQAVIPLSSIEYAYGFGVYETIRVTNGIPYFLDDHAERLAHSARTIELEHLFTKKNIEKAIYDLVGAIGEQTTCNLKVLLIGAATPNEAQLIILPLAPLFPNKQLYRDGVKTITVRYERVFPQAKTLNMLPSYVYYRQAKRALCYDALLVDHTGAILEGTRTNFFCIKDKTLIIPPSEQVLEGVTKKTIIYVAQRSGFTVQEQTIPLSDILHFDGAFLTGTSVGIAPIRIIDTTAYAEIPQSLRDLMKQYDIFKKNCGGKLPK